VRGFAEYDVIDASALRPGRTIIVYCQMVGLVYEPMGVGDERFRSRLGSRVELVRDGVSEPVWSQDFDPADDVCRKPRQDYYASYPIVLPMRLAPGTYYLRLIQTDTLAERSTRRELTLTIRP